MPRSVSSFRLAGAAILLFIQIWAFWPSSLDRQTGASIQQASTAPEKAPDPVFPGFEPPAGASPDYGIQGLNYISVLQGRREWQIKAEAADFYSKNQWVFARRVKAELFTDDQPGVQVEGQFARYSPQTRNLDVGGKVVARFPDGTTLRMELLEFRPAKKLISVPIQYRVHGTGPTHAPARLTFESSGLQGHMDTGVFELKSKAETEVRSHSPTTPITRTWSSSAVYRRSDELVELRSAAGSNGNQVEPVRLDQGTLKATAQKMDVRLPSEAKKASFLATEDVRIEEWKKTGRSSGTPDRYSTCGRAEFDPETQEVVLSDYPQVYQDGDTMTGEVIRILRQEDLVEVENTNAFTRGGPRESL